MRSPLYSRRQMLTRCSLGFGSLALAHLFGQEGRAAAASQDTKSREEGGLGGGAIRRRNARVDSVIFCYMSGGFSHLDSFDPKPELRKRAGQPMPVPVQPTMFNNNGNIMPSPWKERPYGQSGLVMTDLFPRLAECADDLTLIRSMTTKVNEHAQGNYMFHTGFPFMGHPSAGAWMSYGLGSGNRDLPSFVVLQSGSATAPHGGVGVFSSGYLPGQHQASILKVDGDQPLAFIKPGESDARQRTGLEFIRSLDAGFLKEAPDANVAAAIENYETAYRMQAAVPELCDLKGESEATKRLYGVDSSNAFVAAYAKQALVARRLVERGVRFVELSCLAPGIGAGGAPNPWDQHGKLREGHGAMAEQVDQPVAGLIRDLKARGLFERTLIVFAGEFGRTPFSQGSDGRDHNPMGFSVVLAGGGLKRGIAYGATDDLGYYAVEEVATVYDLWATVQELLGLDHEKLTYRFGGRDFRLSEVHGHVLKAVLA
jgi:hypothetical protein